MSTGLALFQRAEMAFYQGKPNETFEYYQKAIKKIIKDENVTANVPAILPDDSMPRELLGIVWRNFMGFFRDPAMNFREESHPDAYKLLYSFRPTAAPKSQERFDRTPRGKILLKAMQITAGMTLGLLAWDKRDRATAAKRYQEALDLAATHAPFVALSPAPGTVGLEKWVLFDVHETRDNLRIIVRNDELNAGLGAETKSGQVPARKDVVDLPLPQARIDKTGNVTVEETTKFATTPCAKCGKRGTRLQRCSQCREVSYCDSACQTADWKSHKKACKKPPASQ